MRSTTRTSAWCSAGDAALVIDTRTTHPQAREILDDLRELTSAPVDGRRRHPRPLRPRLRQPRLPPGDDLGPRRLRTVHGSGPGMRAGRSSPPSCLTSPPNCARWSSTRPTGRSRSRRSWTSATARSSCATWVAATPTTTDRARCPEPACCSPATCSRTARSRRSATPIRSTGRPRSIASLPLVERIVVPGHGDHGGPTGSPSTGRCPRTPSPISGGASRQAT